ncbi:MAG: thioesterase family protein [Candidatus Kapabacteria bacterium]|nr:thioesterase family protein [Candidatus Kapabacteria bacterium]
MLKVGLTHVSTLAVEQSNTALALGSGDLPVFATPAMTALMENAAMLAVAGELQDAESTVGSMLNISHSKPSPLGEQISATAELIEIDGRKLTFRVSAFDSCGVIGEGTHIRYVVNREKFMSKIK